MFLCGSTALEGGQRQLSSSAEGGARTVECFPPPVDAGVVDVRDRRHRESGQARADLAQHFRSNLFAIGPAMSCRGRGGENCCSAKHPNEEKCVNVVNPHHFWSRCLMDLRPQLGFFDPLGLVRDADQAEFDRLREVELKHGR